MAVSTFALPARFAEADKNSFWDEFIELADKYKPIDLGQGYPDFEPPECVLKHLKGVVCSDNLLLHQYTRGYGHPRLVSALAQLYSTQIGREINAKTEILVTSGAYGALFLALLGHVDVGDEVIIIEPFFDCYKAMVQTVGGVPVYVSLKYKPGNTSSTMKADDWIFDENEMERKFNSKTKVIIVNTPHNPLGKVFTYEELEIISNLCKKWNVLCIADEVYEWMVYDDCKHIRMATLPGMWDRTITVCSGGKTFGITGWRIGWAYGSVKTMRNMHTSHDNSLYNTPTPIQEAVAIIIENELSRFDSETCYFKTLPKLFQAKRDKTANIFAKNGIQPVIPSGGYFITANWSSTEDQIDLRKEAKDFCFGNWMIRNIGVLALPLSLFCSPPNKSDGQYLVRICFVKSDEKLDKTEQAFAKWQNKKWKNILNY